MTQSAIMRESVGVFDNAQELHETVKELGTAGFGRQDISVVGSEPAREEIYNREQVPPEVMEDDPNAPHHFAITPEEVGVGRGVIIGVCMLAGFVISALASSNLESLGVSEVMLGVVFGGIAGIMLAQLIGSEYLNFNQRQLNHGGLLLWVRSANGEMERKAHAILRKHGARNVHVHEVPATNS
jgi:hypothetical protein